jgi:hypothetical protein
MSRKKKSGAEDLMDLVAAPWRAGVALAVVLYLVLQRVAVQQVVATARPGRARNL